MPEWMVAALVLSLNISRVCGWSSSRPVRYRYVHHKYDVPTTAAPVGLKQSANDVYEGCEIVTRDDFDRNDIAKPRMIVFDKDGTLGDCTPALHLWCKGMTADVQKKCQTVGFASGQSEGIISSFHKAIGWDTKTHDLVPSCPLSSATWQQIIELSSASLLHSGLNVDPSEVLKWHQTLGDIHSEDTPLIDNLPMFLTELKRHDIMISICTSDDRSPTNSVMQHWGITNLVDFSICGDELTQGKPSPEAMMLLCHHAGVLPNDCVVVGDTSSDTLMGSRSGAGIVVGVLTGSGTTDQLLETGAHVVLPNVGYLTDLLLPDNDLF